MDSLEKPISLWIMLCVCTTLHGMKIQTPTDSPEVETKNVTAHYCPFPCTAGNQTLCYPPPCPPPFCVDPAKIQPTDCCEYCPNGPDCRGPDGSIVKYNEWRIIEGKNCTCGSRDIMHNAECHDI